MKSSTQADQVHRRAVIWIDHLTAKIFAMGVTGVSSTIVHAHLYSTHLHHHANAPGSGHVGPDPKYLAAVAKVVEACDDVLILGPATEKTALMRHLQAARPKISLRMEPNDHPTDEEIVAIGRKHFDLSEPRA